MTEQQAQNIIAFLELARTAIDDAEIKVAFLPDSDLPGLAVIKTRSQIAAAAMSLSLAAETLNEYTGCTVEKTEDASATHRVAP